MSGTAVVLAGHGSHISPNTAGIVWEQVDNLRAMGVADEVTAAFWKEMPSFHTVFNTLESTDITVVPLFTAQGYFTQTVIPAEMGLTGALTEQDGRVIRYTRTLGEHPYLLSVVEQWVNRALRDLDAPPDQVAVAIIGHSTRRNPDSRKAAEAQAAHLRGLHRFAQVEAVYLDDSPAIADIYAITTAPNLIAIPFFLAEGSHTTIDVVRELGLSGAGGTVQQVSGRNVVYTPPVGLTRELTRLILELVQEVGAPLKPAGGGSPWDCFPAVGRRRFWQMMNRMSPVDLGGSSIKFGQLNLTMESVSHHADDNPADNLADPASLRQRVRENPFRPLATRSDLPRGWRVLVNHDLNRLHAIVETIYPGVVGDILGHQFSVGSLKATLARQTGAYRQLEELPSHQTRAVVNRVCGGCIRYPNWHDRGSVTGSKPSRLLCPEPCNVWLSAALRELRESKAMNGKDDEE